MMDDVPHLKPASKYVSVVVAVIIHELLSVRLSVEHFGKEVRELKQSLKQMGNKMKAAPKDFKKQMDEFMEVSWYLTTQDM